MSSILTYSGVRIHLRRREPGLARSGGDRRMGEIGSPPITITTVYSSELLDHFQNPRNVGDVETPDVSAQLENPACGDVLKLTAKLTGRQIADLRFRAKGCVPAMACGSALTELIKGKTIEEARQVSRKELVRKVGGLPPASTHASHLAMDTLAKLLRGL